MNILLLTYQGDVSGATNSIYFLARGLAERGHNVYVGCSKEAMLFRMLSETKVVLIPMVFKNKVDIKNIRHIKKVVEDYQIDLMNAQSGRDRYTSILAKWIYGLKVKLVHTRRQKPESIGGYLQNWFYTKGTDKIIAISDELKSTLAKKGLPGDHIHVIYNGIPVERYRAVKDEEVRVLKERFGIRENDIVIGCVSRRKKQEQIIEALPFLDENIKVIFVGIDSGSLDEQIQKLEVKQQIIYAGVVKGDAVLNYYKLFILKVLPSTMDGFGLVLVEAMALGVPVVATRAEGIINVVEENKSGLLFEDGNIQELVEKIKIGLYDQEKRTELIANGKKRALETFSMKNTLDNYEKFFRELVAGEHVNS